jgi:hypothetical protein
MSVALADLLLDTLRLKNTADGERLSASWHAVHTTGLNDLLEYEGASLWLYRRLADLGMLALPDPTFATELTKHARHITAYNLMVDAQRDAVVRALGAEGIPHLLLKGSALRLTKPWLPYADARLIADVDVLVPPDCLERAWHRLHDAGFAVAAAEEEKYEEHHHLPPVTDGRGIMVELNRSISQRIKPIRRRDHQRRTWPPLEYDQGSAAHRRVGAPHTGRPMARSCSLAGREPGRSTLCSLEPKVRSPQDTQLARDRHDGTCASRAPRAR